MEAGLELLGQRAGGKLQEQVVEALGLDLGGQRHQLVEVRRGQRQRVVILLGDAAEFPGGCR